MKMMILSLVYMEEEQIENGSSSSDGEDDAFASDVLQGSDDDQVEKVVLEQSNSQYELQGEYVLPGSRDHNMGNEDGSLLRRAMAGHLGSLISSMGLWRMRLEVPRAEIAEMLPLARLVSRSTDLALQFRSKDLFIQSIQSVGIDAESLQKLLEEIRGHYQMKLFWMN